MLVLLDRDGVVNQDRADGVVSHEQFVLLPRVPEALALLKKAGCGLAIVTNQSSIGRGRMEMAALHRIHEKMQAQLRPMHAEIDAIFVCPDPPDAATYRRKPAPGMLIEAMEAFGASASRTPMIGDALTDMQAAAAAGCPRYLVRTGKGAQSAAARIDETLLPVTVCDDLYEAAMHIVTHRL